MMNSTIYNKLRPLHGLEGNPPTSLNPLQKLIAPYVPLIIKFYWIVWFATLFYLLTKYFLMPLLKKKKTRKKPQS